MPESLRPQAQEPTPFMEEQNPSDDGAQALREPKRTPDVIVSETINPKHIDADARRLIRTLRKRGFEAYLVGGCVRDLLLDKQPKDFDVITAAMPAEVKRVFSNSRIVGRRFRLVHVLFSAKMIEVSTFRAASTPGFLPSKLAKFEELNDASIEELGYSVPNSDDEDEQAKAAADEGDENEDDENEGDENEGDDDSDDGDDDSDDGDVDGDDDDDEGDAKGKSRAEKSKKRSAAGRNGSNQGRRSRRSRRNAVLEEDEDPTCYGEPWQDAWRRDFTLNALFYDPETREILDFSGGLADIEARVIRSIREPMLALAEDPVRILRAIRFSGKLGFSIEEETLAAIKAHAPKFALCSQRRIFEEILKILTGGHAASTMRRMIELDVLSSLLPEISTWIGDNLSEAGFIEEVVEEEEEESEEERRNRPLFDEERRDTSPLKTTSLSSWEPARFMVDAMVQVSWRRPPMEGSSEWLEDPDEELSDDLWEAAAFARDQTCARVRLPSQAGLRAERERCRSLLKVLKHNDLIDAAIGAFVIDNLEGVRIRQLVSHLEDRESVAAISSRNDRFLRYMAGIDALRDRGIVLSTSLVLAALFVAMLDEEDFEAIPDRLDEIMTPIVERQCLSRRDRDQTRRLLLMHFGHKINRSRKSTVRRRRRNMRQLVTRRSQFNELLLLRWLRSFVHCSGWADFLQWEEEVYAPGVGTRPSTFRVGLSLEDDWSEDW